MVNHNTQLYIVKNEVEQRLGQNMHVHERYILWTISQKTPIYINGHPHPSTSYEASSP
jgi:hypothetical protein